MISSIFGEVAGGETIGNGGATGLVYETGVRREGTDGKELEGTERSGEMDTRSEARGIRGEG
jgi:hypothetical protein